jgi:hypothetical protein
VPPQAAFSDRESVRLAALQFKDHVLKIAADVSFHQQLLRRTGVVSV